MLKLKISSFGMLRIKKQEHLSEKFILLGLILTSLNLAQSFYYILFLTFGLLIFKRKVISLDITFLWSLFFTATLLIFWKEATVSLLPMIRVFAYPVAYLFGYNYLVNRKANEEVENQLVRLIVAVSLGTFLHLMLNFLINMDQQIGRNTIDIWTGKMLAATGQTALACMMIGCSLGVLLSGTSEVKHKILASVAVLLMLLYNMILAGRTMIALTAIIFAVLLLNYLHHFQASGKTIRLILTVFAAVLLILVCYHQNLLGIRDVVLNSNLYERFFGASNMGILEDTRSSIRSKYIEYMPQYFLGGSHIRQATGTHAHELYLNVYDEAGIFAYFAVIGLVVSAAIHLLRFLRQANISFVTKQIMLGVFLAINIMFFLEPVLLGMPWLIVWLCLLHGSVSRYNHILKGQEHQL